MAKKVNANPNDKVINIEDVEENLLEENLLDSEEGIKEENKEELIVTNETVNFDSAKSEPVKENKLVRMQAEKTGDKIADIIASNPNAVMYEIQFGKTIRKVTKEYLQRFYRDGDVKLIKAS